MQTHFRDLGHAGSKMLEAFTIALGMYDCNWYVTAQGQPHWLSTEVPLATDPASMAVNNKNGGNTIRKKHTWTHSTPRMLLCLQKYTTSVNFMVPHVLMLPSHSCSFSTKQI